MRYLNEGIHSEKRLLRVSPKKQEFLRGRGGQIHKEDWHRVKWKNVQGIRVLTSREKFKRIKCYQSILLFYYGYSQV